jgi:PLP dependent protein
MIEKNLRQIEETIAKACVRVGRNRSEIKLIAVSKTQPIELIRDALRAGIVHLGENKAQELRDKSAEFKENINWHFIGHLQTNKVKYIIEPAEYIHSVDSKKLVEEISHKAERIGKKQKILLEIKTSNEATKYGLESEKEIIEIAEFCKVQSNIDLVGLMTMAPYTNDETIIRNCFIMLRDLKENLNKNGLGLTELSMGMTNDFEIAIEEGATLLRIGTAIFGNRIHN